MGNSASSQGSSTGTHDGGVGSSISEEQHDWPIEQAADIPEIQSLQEMRKPYTISNKAHMHCDLLNLTFDSLTSIAYCRVVLD